MGLKSSGIHSNGLSLARKALFGEKRFSFNKTQPSYDKTIIDSLLVPTRIYVNTVLGAVEKIPVRGIAHITGGGVQSNIKRLLSVGLDVQIFWDSFPALEIFDIIAHGRRQTEFLFHTAGKMACPPVNKFIQTHKC